MLDNALTVGMTPDEFWYDDPEYYFNYLRVYEAKQKADAQNIWAIGARMCQALGSTLIFPAGVVDNQAVKQMPHYPECPFTDTQPQEMTEEEKELEIKRAQIHFKNWVDSFKGR